MLFDRPLASFTNNIIYIDRPKKSKDMPVDISQLIYSASNLDVPKGIAEIVRTKSFKFLKGTFYHIPHNNFKTLPLPSKLQREKWREKLSQILDPLLFSEVFSCFFSFETQAHASGFSHRTKIYRTCAARCPSARFLSNELIWSLKEFALGTKTWGY